MCGRKVRVRMPRKYKIAIKQEMNATKAQLESTERKYSYVNGMRVKLK